MNSITLLILNILLSSGGAFFVAKNGRFLNLIDHPSERSSHAIPIPKGGGIGILIAFIFTATILKIPTYFLWNVALISLLGLVADRFELTSKFRLLIQIICGSFFLFMNSQSIFLINEVFLGCLLLIFIVGTTNIYNFMDGIDGIAAIAGIIGFGLLIFYSYQQGIKDATTIMSLSLIFSCLGFLPFNIPKAKVFMGDVGSALLGYAFACLAILISRNILDFICICSFLFTFYTDESITMFIRIKNGENLLQAHRKHFYQFLANNIGIKHWKISIAYGIIQLTVGALIIFLRPFGIAVILLSLAILFIIIAFFVFSTYNRYLVRSNELMI